MALLKGLLGIIFLFFLGVLSKSKLCYIHVLDILVDRFEEVKDVYCGGPWILLASFLEIQVLAEKVAVRGHIVLERLVEA